MKSKTPFGDADATALPSSEEEEDPSVLDDDDICSPSELNKLFSVKYKIADESAVTLKKDYVLSLCHDTAFTRLAAGLSNASVQIFDINNQHGLQHAALDCISPPPANAETPINICGVRFLDESPNCLLVGTTNGLIRLFDLRTQKEVGHFEEDPTAIEGVDGNANASYKTITCFDRNANGRILCAGSEQYLNNVYLLFYDVRERKQMGGYFESHQDDVTTLRFHSQNPDLLCSGSTDGLINIYDIKETTEDDALITTINTESSVHKVNWHKNVYEKDLVSCITHTNDFKIYLCEEGDDVGEFERCQLTKAMKRKNPANCNLIDAHNTEDGGVFLLGGTNFKKGEIMRSLLVQNKQLIPLADFEGNKQIVRESVYDSKTHRLITGGESGIVSLWTPQTCEQSTTMASSSAKLKSKTKIKSNKTTPY